MDAVFIKQITNVFQFSDLHEWRLILQKEWQILYLSIKTPFKEWIRKLEVVVRYLPSPNSPPPKKKKMLNKCESDDQYKWES